MPGKRMETAGSLPNRLSTFVGRQALLGQLRHTVTKFRQTTLIGLGGAGKTRLALELAEQVHRSFDDVRLVELVSATAVPNLLVEKIAEAVGVRDTAAGDSVETLVEVLVSRGRLLLVLDNCEHLAETIGPLVANLLADAPQLHVLATSRERLAIPGEQVVDVPPLTLPRSAKLPIDLGSEALQMFIERATARVPGWQVTEQNWASVVRVLNLIGGIPMLIELAVARLRSMSVEVLVPRMETSMEKVLTRGDRTVLTHHQSLASGCGWSYEMLGATAQMLWARAAVFHGGFDLAAAEAVCSDERLPVADIADVLADLVDKSIIIPTPDRDRYVLLEPLRQYGQGKLREFDDEASVRLRHRDYYTQLAVTAANRWLGPDEVRLLHGVAKDMPNLRAAMTAALASPETAEIALLIAVCLGRSRWLFKEGKLPEGRHWLQLGLAATLERDTPLYAGAVALDAWVAICLGVEHQEVAAQLAKAAEYAERSGEPAPGVTFALGGYTHFVNGTCPATIPLLREAADQFGQMGEDFRGDQHMAEMMISLSEALLTDGENPPPDSRAQAVRSTAAFLKKAERTGAPWAITWALWSAGIAHARAGDLDRGMEMVIEALRQQMGMLDRWGPVFSLPTLAWMLAQPSDLSQEVALEAATLVGASHKIERLTKIRISRHVPHTRFRTEAEEILRKALSAGDYAAAVARGEQVQSIEEALRLTLAEPSGDDSSQSLPEATPELLTAQQWKVAQLIAENMSNREIAAVLSLSPRTVEHHLQGSYVRLGLNPGTRERLAEWVLAVLQQ